MHNEYYEKKPIQDPQIKREYWEVGKGLQKVDGLITSPYLDKIAEDHINGKYDIDAAVGMIEQYYEKMDPNAKEVVDHAEADIVSARINKILLRGSFSFSAVMLKIIHKELFDGILPDKRWVGQWRTVDIEKNETVLNGRSVSYGYYGSIQMTLDYDFQLEKESQYKNPFTKEQIKTLAGFVSSVWQVHPFREGNTRTTAVFIELYLRNMGIPVDNKMFENHSQYFRDALVRSEYANFAENINYEKKYLEMFFENLLMAADHDLESFDLRCEELFKNHIFFENGVCEDEE